MIYLDQITYNNKKNITKNHNYVLFHRIFLVHKLNRGKTRQIFAFHKSNFGEP